MGHFIQIFKILLILQIFSHALASYGHPDAEVIDFGTDPSRDQSIIEAAIRRGMDGEAVAELLRTKQPVVRVVTSPSGLTKTTTYKLENDGSISSKTITQSRKSYTYNSGSIPDDLRNSPTGTVTRTFTDENGHKVTQTISIDKPKPSTVLDTDDLTGDWFNKPFPSWQPETALPSSHRTFTRTWSSNPDLIEPITTTSQATPVSNYHRTITRTYTGPNGEKHVTQTTSTNPDDKDFLKPKNSNFPSVDSETWPGFDFPAFSQPWDSSDPNSDSDWTIVEGNPDVETTTKHKFETWTPKTWNWPVFPTTTTTTTAKPKIFIEPELPARKPLPSLEDFLKSQYGPTTTTSKTQTTTTAKATTTPKIPTTTPKYNTAPTSTKKPIHINIEDLPVTEILHNGKAADESLIKNLPPNLKPKLNTDNIFKIENIHPVDQEGHVDIFTPKKETNIRTYTNSFSSSQKPTIKDLDPEMQEVLKKAGISPEDITNINGDTITKTRTEPDGRTITTTYKIKTVPSVVHTSFEETSPPIATSHSYTPYKPIQIPALNPLKPLTPLTPFAAHLSPISEFLAKLGLTKFDVSSQNGRLSKTFIDEDGDILTATFVLSSSMRKRSAPEMKDKPLK